jgi:hypothetical protein
VSVLLRELEGRQVLVYSSASAGPFGGGTDGVVRAAGRVWLSLQQYDRVLVPLRTIRLIKVAGGGLTAQAAEGDLQEFLLGRTVQVTSSKGEANYTDTGTLEAFDDEWLRVRAGSAQLLFAVHNVTQLKI